MILVLIAMTLWAIVHTYTAGRFKSAFRSRFGDRAYHGLYRILYNAFSLVTLGPIMLLVISQPGGIVWTIDPTGEPVLIVIQLTGLVGLTISLLQIDVLRFLGLRQVWAYVQDRPLPLPEEPMQTGGVYALVRHPLYFFAILATWAVTTMTEAYLGWCVGVTAYFLIGSRLEERRLAQAFGETYNQYRARVPWMFPLPRPRG